jgi:hypothetical protein
MPYSLSHITPSNLSFSSELKELVQIHMDDKEKENEEPLTNDEVLILKVHNRHE